jgi:hypothetical protein
MSGEAAQAEKRVALVIGNGAYDHAAALINPGNDALGIAERLSAAGFDQIIQHQDLGFEAMRRAIQAFGRTADGADIAVVRIAVRDRVDGHRCGCASTAWNVVDHARGHSALSGDGRGHVLRLSAALRRALFAGSPDRQGILTRRRAPPRSRR